MPGAIYRTVLMSKQQKVKRSGFGLHVNCFYFEFKLSSSPHTQYGLAKEMLDASRSALIAVMLYPVHKAVFVNFEASGGSKNVSRILNLEYAFLIDSSLSRTFLKCSA